MTRAREISNVLGRNIESTTFTATAGQTAFSITHAAGRIQVYMNGLLLDPTVDWTSDGSTVTLTEGAVAGDELEVVKFDNLAVADAIPRTGHTGTIDFSDATFVPPAGHIIQTAFGELTTRVQTNTTSWNDIGLSATITPQYANSKILISCFFGRIGTNQTNGDHGGAVRILRGVNNANFANADINGPADGNRPRGIFKYEGRVYNADHTHGGYGTVGFDAPNSTSSLTYKAQVWSQVSSYPTTINGSHNNLNANNDYNTRTKSFLILQEVAQ